MAHDWAPPRPGIYRLDPLAAEYLKGVAGQRGHKTLDLDITPKEGQLSNEGTLFDIAYSVGEDGRELTLTLNLDGIPIWQGCLK